MLRAVLKVGKRRDSLKCLERKADFGKKSFLNIKR